MSDVKLTTLSVEKLTAPKEGRKDVYDARVPGLVLRASSSGGKSWSFTYRIGGSARRLSLG